MNMKRMLIPLVTGAIITLIGAAETNIYVLREVLAAFLIFWTLVGALGIAISLTCLLGDGIVSCFDLLVTRATSFRLSQAAPSVLGPLNHEIGKS
jgi:hypothetical protein